MRLSMPGGLKTGLTVRAPPNKLNVFGSAHEEEEEDVKKMVRREGLARAKDDKLDETFKKALEEDPDAFDYDGVYDNMKRQQDAERRVKHGVKGESRYIAKIVQESQRRQREWEAVEERKIQKERQAEGDEFADKDKYVTAAFKKHMIEQKKWQEEQDRLAREEEDVTKKKDMSGFFFNMLTNNVSMGSETATAKRTGQKDTGEGRRAEKSAAAKPTATAAAPSVPEGEVVGGFIQKKAGAGGLMVRAPSPERRVQVHAEDKDVSASDEEDDDSSGSEGETSRKRKREDEAAASKTAGASGGAAAESNPQSDGHGATEAGDATEEPEAKKPKVVDRVSKAEEAKARFLARKQAGL